MLGLDFVSQGQISASLVRLVVRQSISGACLVSNLTQSSTFCLISDSPHAMSHVQSHSGPGEAVLEYANNGTYPTAEDVVSASLGVGEVSSLLHGLGQARDRAKVSIPNSIASLCKTSLRCYMTSNLTHLLGEHTKYQ